MIKEAQRNAINMNPGMAAATLVSAQADAMKAAANNASGAMNGFIGMNMANGIGGSAATQLFQQGQQATGGFCPQCGKPVNADANFCPACGYKLK